MVGIKNSDWALGPEYWLCAAFVAATGFVYLIPMLFPSANGSAYLVVHMVLTIIMLMVWRNNTLNLKMLLLVGVIARVLLIGTPVFTTHDVERYLWDGAVMLTGYDPYITSADDPAIADLRAYWPTPEENAKYPTIYPPGSLLLFAFSALFGPLGGLYVWKAVVAGIASLSLYVAANLFKRLDIERHFALIALSPLLILEGGIGGHIDAVTTLLVLLSVQFFMDKHFVLAGILIGLGASVKLFPIIFLAPMLGHLGLLKLNRRHVALIFGAIVSIALIYGSVLLAGYEPVGVIETFLKKWRFGSPIYLLIENYFNGDGQVIISMGLATLLTIFATLVARRDFINGMLIMAASPFLISPVVYPWYLMVLVPFVAMRPSAFMLGWVTIVPFSYEVIDRYNDLGIWAPLMWPIYLIAIGWVVGASVDVLRLYKPRSVMRVIKMS